MSKDAVQNMFDEALGRDKVKIVDVTPYCKNCEHFSYHSTSRGTCGHFGMRGYLGLDGDGELSDEDGCNRHKPKEIK